MFSRELADLNTEISSRITVMEDIISGNASLEALAEFNPSARRLLGFIKKEENATESDKLLAQTYDLNSSEKWIDSNDTIDKTVNPRAANPSKQLSVHSTKSISSSVSRKATNAFGSVLSTAKGASKLATSAVGTAVNLVAADREGAYYSGGFVSFKTLSLKYAALQMLHHDAPFMMSVSEAPDPEDVFWTNVGREHEELQVGEVVSRAASVCICLLWTIPMAFFASLSTVEGLKKQFDFIADAIEVFPPLEPILQQLAPLLVVMFNSL